MRLPPGDIVRAPAWLLLLMACASSHAAQAAGQDRVLIAVVAQNTGTEPTDFLVPFAILAGSGAADVRALAVDEGEVSLHPANVTLEVHGTITTFDAEFPQGADYVIVPAVHDPRERRLLDWLRMQRTRGATIMGVCDGARVLAHAGLLEGRAATADWYALDELRREFASTQWRNDRRYVLEDGVVTTSGVSASVPATLALLERIAGPTATRAYADQLGVTAWGAEHDGASFRLTGGSVRVAVLNRLAFWRNERLGLRLPEGVDEAGAALIIDAYSRTWRSSVQVQAAGQAAIRTRHGLTLRSRRQAPERMIDAALLNQPLGRILNATLDEIEGDYGRGTAAFVALQVEHVRGEAGATASP
jgi:putative intracellular protease/amidase